LLGNYVAKKKMGLSYSILVERINLPRQTVTIGQFNSRTTYNTSKWEGERSVQWFLGSFKGSDFDSIRILCITLGMFGVRDFVRPLVFLTGHVLESGSVSVHCHGSHRRKLPVILDKVSIEGNCQWYWTRSGTFQHISFAFPRECWDMNKLNTKTTKLRGLSPRAKYTDRATAACRRSYCQLLRIEGATWSAWGIPTAVFSAFWTRAAAFSSK
jgi:hypothetical protein